MHNKTKKKKFLFIYYSSFPFDSPPAYYLSLAKELSKDEPVIFLYTHDDIVKKNILAIIFNYLKYLMNIISFKKFYTWKINSRFSKYTFLTKLYIYKNLNHQIVVLKNFAEKTSVDGIIPVDLKLFDCTDHFYPEEFKNNSQELKKFDAIFVNFNSMQNLLKKYNASVIKVPTGYLRDIPKFKKVRKIPNSVIFSGGISRRIDFNLLIKLVQALKDYKFYFIGEVYLNKYYLDSETQDTKLTNLWKKLLSHPNVQYLGHFDVRHTQRLLGKYSVGIIPYNTSDFMNRYSNPMKLYEYLYQGLPVVSTKIKAVEEKQKDFPVLVAANSLEFIKKIKLASQIETFKINRRSLLKENYISNKRIKINKYLYEH